MVKKDNNRLSWMKYPIYNTQTACLTLPYYTRFRRTPQGCGVTVWLLQIGTSIIKHPSFKHIRVHAPPQKKKKWLRKPFKEKKTFILQQTILKCKGFYLFILDCLRILLPNKATPSRGNPTAAMLQNSILPLSVRRA